MASFRTADEDEFLGFISPSSDQPKLILPGHLEPANAKDEILKIEASDELSLATVRETRGAPCGTLNIFDNGTPYDLEGGISPEELGKNASARRRVAKRETIACRWRSARRPYLSQCSNRCLGALKPAIGVTTNGVVQSVAATDCSRRSVVDDVKLLWAVVPGSWLYVDRTTEVPREVESDRRAPPYMRPMALYDSKALAFDYPR